MTLNITIDCSNVAFEGENLGPEIARILKDLSERYDGPIVRHEFARNLYDVNGNHVGEVRVS